MAENTTTFGVPNFANISEGDTFAMTVNGKIAFNSDPIELGPFIVAEIRLKKAEGMEITDCPYITFPHQQLRTQTLEYRYVTDATASPANLNLFQAPDRGTTTATPAFTMRFDAKVLDAQSGTCRLSY